MYVIELTNTTGSTVNELPNGAVANFPADRCRWTQDQDTTGGYSIRAVHFYPGNAATEDYGLVDARLGYIAKTGRFVPITN